MNTLLSMFVWQNLFVQFAITLVAFGLCRGEPWSFRYLLMALIYLTHGAFALESFDSSLVFAKIQVDAGIVTPASVDSMRTQVDFGKLSIPVISIGIGCSMIASFLSSSKPRS